MNSYVSSSRSEERNLPTNFTRGWGELAESLLCDGESAAQIRDALTSAWPGVDWFVLVESSSSSWAASIGAGEYQKSHDICGKNMLVWRYAGSVGGCSNQAGDWAQFLIDEAVAHGGSSTTVRDYITDSKTKIFVKDKGLI